MIVIDTREPKELYHKLQEHCDEVSRETLSAGDFLVDDKLIERKDYGDYIGRLKSDENDIFIQMMATVEAAEEQDLEVELLLEGDWKEALHWSDISMHYIVASMAGIRKMGVSMMHTPDLEGTARYLATLEKEETKGEPKKIRNTPSVPSKLMPVYLCQGFDKVGAKTGKRLLAHFGSFKAIVNADTEELMEVHGVGKGTAEKIVEHCEAELPEEEYPTA